MCASEEGDGIGEGRETGVERECVGGVCGPCVMVGVVSEVPVRYVTWCLKLGGELFRGDTRREKVDAGKGYDRMAIMRRGGI